ncbi:tRNA lysidine(34) synthetase TilS [Tepidimicrobium xylanilyticum]|uniref:tRNA(Ile)-lysidine synthase n=1 Tax=Tepidimicrobium xylanilyticum TaxID=1123352 RepID=A0A1H2XRV2_9FIRM|nr:tRNA lysidine(34) synthetase TilS [Tepidimicrobium xylanilyticum]GMG97573.1 tRNA(Ile)-lysidine synthase [Tepidimicrobium xylanilyticum]SDW95603.1 tRNA(Ile)-lysidine synthase [Tepidimicrobium xylanilyticum]
MKAKVLEVIRKFNLIEPKDNIVVGVSGGPDSMALLYILLEISREIEFNIFIAHLNHGVRGKEALEDEKFVENLAKNLNLPFYSKRVNMDEYARKKGMSSEEAGRTLRYGFFREILKQIGGGKIAVAHNKNDQAETLLMRFFRGTGIDGLKGMEYKNGDIIRPILGIDRVEIEKYLKDRNIEARLDKTNLEPVYNRNRIRLELIPYIEKHFNPNIVDTLWRASDLFTVDSNFLEKHSDVAYKRVVKKRGNESIVLDGRLFVKEDISMQLRIIRNCIYEVNGSLQGFTNRHILDVLNLFLEGKTGKEIHLLYNIIAKTSYDDYIIEKGKGHRLQDFEVELPFDGVTYIDQLDIKVVTKVFSKENVKINVNERFKKYFDYDKIEGNLYIRNKRDGDRFVPYGMLGSKKVKDFFIDEKIPKESRDRIPIITDDNNILWIVGYRTSNIFKITADTKRILMIEIFH